MKKFSTGNVVKLAGGSLVIITGHYMKEINGMDKATYLADNVQGYILKCLTKNFDF